MRTEKGIHIGLLGVFVYTQRAPTEIVKRILRARERHHSTRVKQIPRVMISNVTQVPEGKPTDAGQTAGVIVYTHATRSE